MSSSTVNISPGVVTAILVLSITIILSTFLCLLIRYLIRRCSRHHPDDNDDFAVPMSSSARSFSSIRRVSPQIDDTHRIDSLPLFTFASLISGRKEASNGDCAVCLSKFEPMDELRLLPICCHAFHAECVDTWLQSNQTKTCPLCRSLIFASEDEILSKVLAASALDGGNGSFRVEIGNVSRHRQLSSDLGAGASRRSSTYSIGSFDYVIEAESEVATAATLTRAVTQEKDVVSTSEATTSNATGGTEVGGGGISRSWLREYVDRLSSRTLSFRSSERWLGLGGSDRRNDEYDVEANRAGEEITEMFRWFSSV